MISKLKNVVFVVCLVMVLTAQANRPEEEKHNQAKPQGAPQARTQAAPQARTQSAPRMAPQQVIVRKTPPQQAQAARPQASRARSSQPSYQPRVAPRVYAVPASLPVANNRLLNRQHHKNWQPLYNFYDNQYHFYPYVNTALTVELSADCVAVVFNGQTYYYDRGTFYLQDEQGQYVALPPPIGILVNVLPSHARQIDINGQIYYRYKGICYVQTPQGFQVVEQVGASVDE
jgi:hypothetical protein